MKFKRLNIEALLGVGLGLGFLTSLRFAGPIGFSEILILFTLLILIKRNPKDLMAYYYNSEKIIRIYFLSTTIIILPIITLIVFLFSHDIQIQDPKYILSFIMGIILMLSVFENIRNQKVNPKKITLWFAITFILANFVSIFIFNLDAGVAEGERYTGGAKNPNQLTFYAATLSLLLITYHKKLALFLIPIIVFILNKAQSDAYMLAIIMITISYIYFRLTFSNKLSSFIKIIFSTILLLIISFIAVEYYGEWLADEWLKADQGNTRLDLMYNALLVSVQSPFFGWGAGSFSGVSGTFQGSEAHNTFLDLSMQFGFLFPTIIYIIIITTLISSLRKKDYLMAAFVVGFIESGLFHFSGRHFSFWIELAVFLGYIYPAASLRVAKSQSPKGLPCAA